MYDLIGDIHGHADELIELLAKLGYKLRNGVWSHEHSMVIFLTLGYTSVVNSDKASVISDKSPTTKAKRPSVQTSGLALAC